MDYYFLVITIIDIFVLGIMCVFIRHNEALTLRKRRCFIGSFILIIAISVLELISDIVNNAPISFRWINIVTNYLGFGLTPAVPVCLSFALAKNRINKTIIIIQLVYMMLLGISVPFDLVFCVSQDNQYMRGEYFWIYIFVYFISVIYLLFLTVKTVSKYQHKRKNSIYLIVVFLLVCTMIQVIFPAIHVSWLCVTLLAILYVAYCNIIWQQLDGLTGLLNQNSYLNKLLSLDKDVILIIFDIDNFKHINDSYGHFMGDECLKEIADCIKLAYLKEGLCYRIGGDEFCVLLNVDADKENCDKTLIKELNLRRKRLDILPHISFGSALFTVGDDIDKIKELADSNMYQMKKEKKTHTMRNSGGVEMNRRYCRLLISLPRKECDLFRQVCWYQDCSNSCEGFRQQCL